MQAYPEELGSGCPGSTTVVAVARSRLSASVVIPLLLLAAVLAAFGLSRSLPGFGDGCKAGTSCTREAARTPLAVPPALPGREAVSPAVLAQIAPDAARALNEKAAFFTGAIVPARPFRFAGSPEDRTRAVECLAAAQLYEAGYGEGDQKAVAQVILNRVRHPAYPHTVCGVVFEGSERNTGCQFTFTCDGSLARRYPDAAWVRARSLAARMLDGEVDKRVGWATHYHTDWVYPYWSSSLDKLAAVNTHLFFKWRGTWGTGPAFAAEYVGNEPLVSRLHGGIDGTAADTPADPANPDIAPILPPLADAPLPAGVAPGALGSNSLKVVHPDGGGFGLLLSPGSTSDDAMASALRLCFGQDVCRVLGWSSAADMPRGFPVPAAALAKLSFSYVRNPDTPVPQFRFDCERFPKVKKTQCLNP